MKFFLNYLLLIILIVFNFNILLKAEEPKNKKMIDGVWVFQNFDKEHILYIKQKGLKIYGYIKFNDIDIEELVSVKGYYSFPNITLSWALKDDDGKFFTRMFNGNISGNCKSISGNSERTRYQSDNYLNFYKIESNLPKINNDEKNEAEEDFKKILNQKFSSQNMDDSSTNNNISDNKAICPKCNNTVTIESNCPKCNKKKLYFSHNIKISCKNCNEYYFSTICGYCNYRVGYGGHLFYVK